MRYLLFVIVAASSYFVEWIPNYSSTSSNPPAQTSHGEFPWQL